jgi:hypothetical protein
MEQEWTIQGLADWAVRAGLQPSLMGSGKGLTLAQPGGEQSIFAIYLPENGDYNVELGFNPNNEQSWLLRDLIGPKYNQIEVDEESRKWPRIGLIDYSPALLEEIKSWAEEFIVTTSTPKPTPVSVAAPTVNAPQRTPRARTTMPRQRIRTPDRHSTPVFRVFSDWKKDLLRQRGILQPDGRPLYLYRVSEREFSDLENLLKEWLAKLSARHGLARIAEISGFSALFVLYAAEWWRRRYDGSGFSWEPILYDLGAEPTEWTPGQRSEQVRRGLRDWELKPGKSGALRFLGAVALQGGLPLRLLAEARGGIGHLLQRVLKESRGTIESQADLHTWVESLSSMLPKSYRKDMIFSLLADVAMTVLRLKKEAGLTSSVNALAILDSRLPNWRERFPLPVEDGHAQGMIEQLIRDASTVNVQRGAIFLPLERLLEPDAEHGWVLRSRLALKDSLPLDQVAKLFRVEVSNLPRTGELSLIAGSVQHNTSLRRMAGNNAYRVERKPWGALDKDVLCEHILRLAAPDGRVWSVTTSKGEVLDEDIPWVFKLDGSSYQLLRQGSGSVAVTDALVALPDAWQANAESDGEIADVAVLKCPKRKLIRVKGKFRAKGGNGLAFRLRTGQAGSPDEHYAWEGQRYWLDFQSPRIAFKGQPSLVRIDDDGNRRKAEGQVGCNLIGASHICPDHGPVFLKYPATGEIKHRSRVLLLPKTAALKYEPRDAVSGAIRLHDWGALNGWVTTPGVSVQLRRVERDIVLDMAVPSGEMVPNYVEVEAHWPHTTTPARFRVPFPAKGVRAFDSKGHEMRSGEPLAVQQLAGVRLFVSCGHSASQIWLEISLSHGKTTRKHRLSSLSETANLEVRLQDYAGDIQQLLSIDDSPDTRVEVTVRIEGAETFTLNLARYAAMLSREGDAVRLDAHGITMLGHEELSSLSVSAMRLECPGDEVVRLSPCFSEGVATGSWSFSPESREPGSWLIFPDADTSLPFRPTLWTVPGETGVADSLAEAINIPQTHQRESAVDTVIREMAADFQHPGWTSIEQLAALTGHLPLATLDIWRRFAHCPEGMAALAFRFGTLPSGFLERFGQELPFAWETVPLAAWRDALKHLKNQCASAYEKDVADLVLTSHVEKQINTLSSSYPALAYFLGIIGARILPNAMQQAQALKFVGMNAREYLFLGEDSPLMALSRTHADEEWPLGFNELLSSIDGPTSMAGYLLQVDPSSHRGVVNLPLLLAVQAATNRSGYWFVDSDDIHLMRTCRAFDPEWFDEAYNQTIARCLADGLLDIE